MYQRVNNCNDCPLKCGYEDNHGDWVTTCNHPNSIVDDGVISNVMESPSWCPLRKGSLTINLYIPQVLESNCSFCKKKFNREKVVRYKSSNVCVDCESDLPF